MASTIQTNLANWSTTLGTNNPQSTDTADIDTDLRTIQMVVRQYLATKGADIASGATVNLAAATGNYVHITGVTTITALGTVSAGMRFLLVFDGALTFTHNATSLILPSAANITTAAGDRCEVVSLGSGNWRCLWYQRANGYPLDATLAALGAWANGTNKIPYTTSTDTVASLDFKDEDNMVSDSATALPSQQSVKAYADTKNIATQVTPGNSGNVLTSNGSAWVSSSSSGISVGTAQASTSGTTVAFTSIPSTAKRITIVFSAVATNGTSNLIVQIGDSGGFETSAYAGGIGTDGASFNSTAGFLSSIGGLSTYVHHGTLVLVKISGNTWVASGTSGRSDLASASSSGGSKTLSGTLDRVHLTSESADTFTAGTVNILVE